MSRIKLITGAIGVAAILTLTLVFVLVATSRRAPNFALLPPTPIVTTVSATTAAPPPATTTIRPNQANPTATPAPSIPTQVSPARPVSGNGSLKDGNCRFENWPPAYLEPIYFKALKPEYQNNDNLHSVRTLYAMQLTLNPAQNSYSGQIIITFANRAPQAMNEIVVRTYPDFFRALGGQIVLTEAKLDGRGAIIKERALTYASIQPDQPVAACTVAHLSLKFEGKLPNRQSVESYAVGTFYNGPEAFALGNFYPQLALWEKLSGKASWDWTITPPQASSDLTAAESAFYDVRLLVPPNYQVIGSGISSETKVNSDFKEWRFTGGPFREFAAVGSENFSPNPLLKTTAQGVNVRLFTFNTPDANLNNRQQDFARKALDATTSTLEEFGAAVAPYPYTQFTLVQFPISGFNGIEWPMFTQLSFDLFQRSYAGQEQIFGNLTFSKPGTLVVIHEVLHQWWYNLVGNDQQAEGFIDEGLAEYCTYLLPELWAKRNNASSEAARAFAESWLDKLRVRVRQQDLPTYGDLKVNSPTSQLSLEQAGFVYYRKAPLFYEAYRAQFGDAAFFSFLKSYFQHYQYELVHYPDLAGQLIAAAQGRENEARDFVERWFNDKKLASDLN